MWGVIFQIRGARLQSSVPGFLTSASGSHASTDYLEACVQELGRDPVRYGFDPGALYTVLAQTWDCAFSPARSVAWGRHKIGHQAVELIPDFYFTLGRGFEGLRAAAERTPPWRERDPTVVWRGAVTGRGPYDAPEDVPRVRLCLLGKTMAGVDFGATQVHDTTLDVLPNGTISKTLAEAHLLRERWFMPQFGNYRYSIDIDGHANAWGLMEKLILGCCVLKVDTPYEQWFYDRLQAGVHYVPVKADLSDLQEKIAWCRENEAACEWIGANGRRLAQAATYEAELQRSCEAILRAARVSQGG